MRILIAIVILLFLTISCNPTSSKGLKPNEVMDIEGNIYQTVTIGTQTWMVSDLRVTKFNDGTPIPEIQDSAKWGNAQTAACCWFNNDKEMTKHEGFAAFYNWHAVNSGKLAPKGWRVPSRSDWKKLIEFLEFSGNDGGSLKISNGWWWAPPNTGATNITGFSALGNGMRWGNDALLGAKSHFVGKFYYGYWWSSSKKNDPQFASILQLSHRSVSISDTLAHITTGISVRCIKN